MLPLAEEATIEVVSWQVESGASDTLSKKSELDRSGAHIFPHVARARRCSVSLMRLRSMENNHVRVSQEIQVDQTSQQNRGRTGFR